MLATSHVVAIRAWVEHHTATHHLFHACRRSHRADRTLISVSPPVTGVSSRLKMWPVHFAIVRECLFQVDFIIWPSHDQDMLTIGTLTACDRLEQTARGDILSVEASGTPCGPQKMLLKRQTIPSPSFSQRRLNLASLRPGDLCALLQSSLSYFACMLNSDWRCIVIALSEVAT
jgi:hypothetical protein